MGRRVLFLSDNMHSGHRMRLKKQLREGGADRLSEYQLLELLLFFSIPREDTNPLAHRLIDKFGTWPAVLSASYEDLCRVEGVSEHTATLLMLCGQLIPLYHEEMQKRRPLENENALAEYLQARFVNEKNEKVVLLSLNNRKEPLACTVVSTGSITAAEAGTREIIEIALRTSATAVVLAHNHPAGHPVPSAEDIAVTKQLVNALRLVDVALVDHFIFAKDEYLSLRRQPRYAPIFLHAMYRTNQ